MKKEFNVCRICNYDGACMISLKNYKKHHYGWCYGDRFGTDECPLKSKIIEVDIKEEFEKDFEEVGEGE